MKKIFTVIVLLCLGVYVWYIQSLRPVDRSSADRVKITVESGWSTTAIADHLHKEGLIRSPIAFRLYVKLTGLDGSLQAGVFLLQTSYSAGEIATMLRTGRAAEVSITVPEGFTVQDIDALLADAGLINVGDAVDCASTCDFSSFTFLPNASGLAERGGKLEGYLFPDTYFVPVDEFVVKFFFERLLGNFRTQVLEPYESVIASSEYSLHEIVTMASLVEEETRSDDERSAVAGILWKRYDEGWGLGVDAAVRYIVNKPTEAITVGDLNVNSPYNLRKFKGMPPGPIANAGAKSIEAALYPKETPYWYYLHDADGQIHYSRTNEEHNLKRIRYLGKGSQNKE